MNTAIKHQTDVLIVGAGPVGLLAGCLLAMHGIKVKIIDKKAQPAVYSGALFIQARTLEIFDQMGLADAMLAKGQIPKYISVLHRGRQVFKTRIDKMGKGLSKFPFVLMLKQEETERLMIDFLRQHSITVNRKTTLTGLQQDEKMVRVELAANKWETFCVYARYLIGADGADSTVARLLTLPPEEQAHSAPLFIFDGKASFAYSRKGQKKPFERDTIHFAFNGNNVAGFFPLPDNKWRIDGVARYSFPGKTQFDEEVIKQGFGNGPGLSGTMGKSDWFSTFQTLTKLVSAYQKGRCFVAGDAAHVHTPIGAQGMNTGLQDAHNLAWKMALVLQGKAPEGLLDTYDEERRPVARKLIRSTDRLFFLVINKSPLYRLMRSVVFVGFLRLLQPFAQWPVVQKAFFKSISETEINYAASRNKKRNKGLHSGQRLPYLFYTDAGGNLRNVHDDMQGSGYVLFCFGCQQPREMPAFLEELRQEQLLRVVVIPFDHSGKKQFKKLNVSQGICILVRPDGYVAERFG